MTALLDAEQLGALLFSFQRRLFRLEALPAYAVASDGDDFHRWRAGDLTLSEHQLQWMDTLRQWRADGRILTRVRVLSAALTDYELYSCHIYSHNAQAGEVIQVLRVGEHMAAEVASNIADFWLVDDETAALMEYDAGGSFDGAQQTPAGVGLRATRDLLWEISAPFEEWWAKHPELQRQRVA